jgi:histone deacetylase 1/2
MSCPYTSAQNGKAKRIIRSTNNMIRSLLFQARVPPAYWAEALHTATHLLNILPTKTLHFSTPHFALFGIALVYDHLRVFGCACYPNLSATASHKLAPRSTLCVFLGYSSHHKGYRCLDLARNRIIISRQVTFDESTFPFAREPTPSAAADLDFLDTDSSSELPPIGAPLPLSASAPTLGVPQASTPVVPRVVMGASTPTAPRAAASPSVAPHAAAWTPVVPHVAASTPVSTPVVPRAAASTSTFGAPSANPTGSPFSAPRAAPFSPPGFPVWSAHAFGRVFTHRALAATPVLALASSPAPAALTPSPAPAPLFRAALCSCPFD